jgi:hypothetical protein
MKIVVAVEVEVKIPEDRANANEVFHAVSKAGGEASERLACSIVEAYQERIVEVLCRRSGSVAKKGLGGHERKDLPGRRCRCRTFRRAGYWSDTRTLRGSCGTVTFRPAVVECARCGKRLTPVLAALELEPYEGRTDELLRKVMEAVAETSYRRGSGSLERLAEVPVAKSTAHRWAATVEVPVQEGSGLPFLGADGTGFHRQPGERGQVRLVVELGENGRIRPLGVWAGTSWEAISEEVKDRLKGQPRLFVGDGEPSLEEWLGKLAERANRCLWHLPRGSGFALWGDGVPKAERDELAGRLRRLVAIEVPEEDVEAVSAEDKEKLRERIGAAEKELEELRRDCEAKGYRRAATYLANTRNRVFNHLWLWLETGLVAPRTASIVENTIRELVRRLKKVGWNWSDAGATRMGRVVLLRRYDEEAWHQYWLDRMRLQDRCKIQITQWDAKRVA